MLNQDHGANAGAAVFAEPTTPDTRDAKSGLVNNHPPFELYRCGGQQAGNSPGAVRGVRHRRGNADDT